MFDYPLVPFPVRDRRIRLRYTVVLRDGSIASWRRFDDRYDEPLPGVVAFTEKANAIAKRARRRKTAQK